MSIGTTKDCNRHGCGNAFRGVRNQMYCSLACALWSRVRVGQPDECWEWSGAVAPGGYGAFSFRAVRYRANRAALILTRGHSNLEALHLCDNPRCCNPSHLAWGTQAENMRQAIGRNRIARSSGGDHWKARLTDEQAAEAKRRLANGDRQLDIAADLGVDRMVVTDIKRGRSYRHVEV